MLWIAVAVATAEGEGGSGGFLGFGAGLCGGGDCGAQACGFSGRAARIVGKVFANLLGPRRNLVRHGNTDANAMWLLMSWSYLFDPSPMFDQLANCYPHHHNS